VRIKNKGKSGSKKGRKKYQAPKNEHPETIQDVSDADIHANHVEAQNSAFRRKTNTYAKTLGALQRTLDLYWVFHNFIKIHFTTKEVPAVLLGVVKDGLEWNEIMRLNVF